MDPRGPALDLSGGAPEETMKSELVEIAVCITGAEDMEIEFDTPLMEAGLKSNSAILMCDKSCLGSICLSL